MRVLLLNQDFHPLAFITDRRAIRLLLKEKVDVISTWSNAKYFYANGFIELPSVIKLKYKITRNFIRMVFTRNAVFKRDRFECQYCKKQLAPNKITIDHIIPKSRGGSTGFENCVSACDECNKRKGSRLPHEIGMKLIKKPETPDGYLVVSPHTEEWHLSWNIFTNID